MSETTITVGVDTNILINFGDFKRFDWKALFPTAANVRVLIAAKVLAEMDVHKDTAAGYVRKRAKAFQKILREGEDSNYVVDFEHQGVIVSCIFLKRPAVDVLDRENFDLNDDDELIVAQYHHAQHEYGDIAILANDASPIRAARHAGMKAMRPDAWEADRSEEEDDITRGLRDEVRRLQRTLGAKPKLEVSGLTSNATTVTEVTFSPAFDISSFRYSARCKLEARFPLPSRNDLIEKFGRQSSFMQNYGISGMFGMGDSELDAWDEERKTFYSHFDRVSDAELSERINCLLKVRVFEFEIRNSGDAVEEDVSIEIDARDNAILVEADDIEELNDWGLTVPKPPRSPGYDLTSLLPIGSRFDPNELESIDVNPHRERLRCKLMMQGQSHRVRLRLLARDEAATSSILISIRARHLLDPIIREVRLVPQHLAIAEQEVGTLMRRHAEFMPSEQADVILAMFE